MLEFLKAHQLNIMLCLSSVCGIIAFFVCLTKTLPKERKRALLLVELGAMLLLVSDRFAYLYRGDVSELGFWMVRISNFLVFFLSIFNLYAFNRYLTDLLRNEGGLSAVPVRLRFVTALAAAGELIVILSQFTGFYYTFDAYNRYQRAPGFVVCYAVPLLILLVQLSVILQYSGRLRRGIRVSLFLFTAMPLCASVVQIFTYGLSVTNLTSVGMTVLLYLFALLDMNETVANANRLQIEYLKKEQDSMRLLFDQTATAMASAIDAKDKFARGHSARVAGYARRIAELDGKNEQECGEVYYAALLHDAGKIGVPDGIFGREDELTENERRIAEGHTGLGREILSSISEYPFLSIAANYHHERFDGEGYPEGLRGEAIPEIARIVAVADAYDAMTSRRKDRGVLPQHRVREEIIKGMGSRFDPRYAKLMLRLIDEDTDYRLREEDETGEAVRSVDLSDGGELQCEAYKSVVSEGILLSPRRTRISLRYAAEPGFDEKQSMPALILFDSFDGCVHTDARTIENVSYLEYGEIWFDGHVICTAARNVRMESVPCDREDSGGADGTACVVEAERCADHARIRLTVGARSTELVIALADATRYAYIGLTGEHCRISDVRIEETEQTFTEDDIPRIAERISYLNRAEGDLPNVQVDGVRTAASKGVPVADGLKLSFHTMSLPTAHLVWQCPYVVLFSADDGKVNGVNYRELALIRLDGEAQAAGGAENRLTVSTADDFQGWDAWKAQNKRGYDCEVRFRRRGDRITTMTENCGIAVRCVTRTGGAGKVYAALTGDQCALTEIRVL